MYDALAKDLIRLEGDIRTIPTKEDIKAEVDKQFNEIYRDYDSYFRATFRAGFRGLLLLFKR